MEEQVFERVRTSSAFKAREKHIWNENGEIRRLGYNRTSLTHQHGLQVQDDDNAHLIGEEAG